MSHTHSHTQLRKIKSVDLLEAESRIVVSRSLSKWGKCGELLVKTEYSHDWGWGNNTVVKTLTTQVLEIEFGSLEPPYLFGGCGCMSLSLVLEEE